MLVARPPEIELTTFGGAYIVGVKRTVCSAGCYVVREKEAREHSALCMAKKRKEEQYIKFVYLTAVFFITYTLIASSASKIF